MLKGQVGATSLRIRLPRLLGGRLVSRNDIGKSIQIAARRSAMAGFSIDHVIPQDRWSMARLTRAQFICRPHGRGGAADYGRVSLRAPNEAPARKPRPVIISSLPAQAAGLVTLVIAIAPRSLAIFRRKGIRQDIIGNGNSKRGSVGCCGSKVDSAEYARILYIFESF